jgi:hypothetical protein
VATYDPKPPGKFVPFHWKHFLIEGRFKTLFDGDVLGFYFGRHTRGIRIDVPHWFLVLAAAGLSVAPWLRERLNFGLRTFFIATTLVAVVLGFAAWAARK